MRFISVLLSFLLVASSVYGRPQAVLHSSGVEPPVGRPSSLSSPLSALNPPYTGPPTTPKPQIPIIRHINRVNNDGSYTFGYESGDGSYRVETRGLDGLIQGRYGYVDEHGVRKEVDYQAGSATGYEPRGTGITVPPRLPPKPPGTTYLDYDDGSYKPASTQIPPLATRTRARTHQVQQQQFHSPPPTQAPPPPPPPPPPSQPQIVITQPAPQRNHHDFGGFQSAPAPSVAQHSPSEFAPPDFSRNINPPSPPQPVIRPVHRPPPASFTISQPQHQGGGGGGGGGGGPGSPIESFLRQQLHTPPQAPPPQQQQQSQFF